MACDRCTRAPVGECVGEKLCTSIQLSDIDACKLAADICLAWWLTRDDEFGVDDATWSMAEQRIDELWSDPLAARAYLAEAQIRSSS